MSVKSVLRDVGQAKYAGGALSASAVAALTRLRNRSALIGVAVLLAILAGTIFAAYLSYAVKPDQIAVVAGGLGLSMGGGLLLLLRTWHEWSEAGLLLILIEDADEATIRSIIDRLVGKL